jgi:hypothetical protein
MRAAPSSLQFVRQPAISRRIPMQPLYRQLIAGAVKRCI